MSRYRPDQGASVPVSEPEQYEHAGASSFAHGWSAFSGLGGSGFNLLGGSGSTRDPPVKSERDEAGSSWRQGSSSRERQDRQDSSAPQTYAAADPGSSWAGPASFASRLQAMQRMSGISSSPSAYSSASHAGRPQRRRLAARHLVIGDHSQSSHRHRGGSTSGSSRVPLVAMTLAPPSVTDSPGFSDARHRTTRVAVAGRREARVLRIVPPPDDHAGPRIEEAMNLRAMSKPLGPGYGASDLAWGYEYTGERIAMACTNGAVVCWNLERSDSKIDVIKFEHARTVNRVTFGAPGGNWLVSGAHDGYAKLWDLRDSGPAQMYVQTHGDPIRHLRFHPNRTAYPFSLTLLTDTGALFTYDLRSANKGALGRVAAHVGAGLGLDWRVGPDMSDGGEADVSWLASGGVDGTVKVWDLSQSTAGTPALLKTLHVARPVQDVAWRPDRPCELAVAMMEGGVGGSLAGTRGAVGSAISFGSDELSNEGEEGAEGDFEVWDLRRDCVPKFVVRGRDGPASALLWSSTDTFLTTHKRTSCLVQHDVLYKPECPLDHLPRQAVSWSADGTLAFAADEEDSQEIPFDDPSDSFSLSPFVPDGQSPAITDALPVALEPTSSAATFRYLALHTLLSSSSQPFPALCDHNASVAREAGRLDLWRLWKDLTTWFADDVVTSLPAEQEAALRAVERATSVQGSQSSRPALRRLQQSTSASPRRRAAGGAASSRSRSRPPSRFESPRLTPVRGREIQSSTEGLSSVEDFEEEGSDVDGSVDGTTTTHNGSVHQKPPREPFPHLTKTESSEEDDVPQAMAARLTLSLSNLKLERPAIMSRQRSASLLGSGAPTPKANRTSFIPLDTISAVPGGSGDVTADEASASVGVRHSSSSDSELSSVATGTARKEAIQRRVARRDRPRSTSRKTPTPVGATKVGEGDEKRRARRNLSKDRIAAKIHRRGASSSDLGSLIAALNNGSSPMVSTSKLIGEEALNALRWKAFERRAEVEVNKAMQARLLEEIGRLAGKGDVQSAFMMSEVVVPRVAMLGGREDGKGFGEARATRWAVTYADMLERQRMPALAAEIRKRSKLEYVINSGLGAATRTTVACGRCGKGMEDPVAGLCPRCHADFVQCTICHLPVRDEPYSFCATCHHGAHRHCISSYLLSASPLGHALAASLSASAAAGSGPPSPVHRRHSRLAESVKSGSAEGTTPTPPATGVSSPGWVGSWFWGEPPESMTPVGAKTPVPFEGREAKEMLEEGLECPSGCGHRGCLNGWLAVAGIA